MITPIQATMSGYSGKPCTLFSAYNDNGPILTATIVTPFFSARRKGCTVITNDPRIDRDVLFTEDQIQAGIKAFYVMQGGLAADGISKLIEFNEEKASSARPSSIEKDKMDGNGQHYRIEDIISNAQIATLATCLYVQNLSAINQATGRLDGLNDLIYLMSGGIVTI